MSEIEKIINGAWENKESINPDSDKSIINTINGIIEDLDKGKIRVAEKIRFVRYGTYPNFRISNFKFNIFYMRYS